MICAFLFSRSLTIFKKDVESSKPVTHIKGAGFKIKTSVGTDTWLSGTKETSTTHYNYSASFKDATTYYIKDNLYKDDESIKRGYSEDNGEYVKIEGLDKGTYHIYEVEPPTGYLLKHQGGFEEVTIDNTKYERVNTKQVRTIPTYNSTTKSNQYNQYIGIGNLKKISISGRVWEEGIPDKGSYANYNSIYDSNIDHNLGGITVKLIKKGANMIEKLSEMPGTRNKKSLEEHEKNIKSKNIIHFSYHNSDFKVECKLENNNLHVISSGGNYSNRDGSAFKLDYISKTKTLLTSLQQIVEKYELYKNNGYTLTVNGLPAGLGDTISVEYDKSEKIYKSSNQSRIVQDEAVTAIYNEFHKNATQNDYEFNTEKSNIKVYDDATEKFLQGTWKGSHFGDEIKVIIKEKNIKIYCNNKLSDNTEYAIINGCVRPNKLKKGITIPKNEHDYEEFNIICRHPKRNAGGL